MVDGNPQDTVWNDDPNISVAITYKQLDPVEHLSAVKTPAAGAVIYFGGITRQDVVGGNNDQHLTVKHLQYEAHVPMALRSMFLVAQIAQKKFTNVETKEAVHKIKISHRLGIVPVGEDSIMIALSSSHRKEGWKCAEWILEEVKAKTEIWKEEVYNDESSQWKVNENSVIGGQ